MKKRISTLLCLAAISSTAVAEDSIKSSVELGMVLTSGNTNTQSTNAKASVDMTKSKWRSQASLEALSVKGEIGGVDTRLSEKYLGTGKVSRIFSENSYGFLIANGEHDPFSGFSYQVGSSLGYGHKIINKESMQLSFEGGPGYRQTKLRNDDAEGEMMFRFGAAFEVNLSKTAKFTEEFTAEAGADLTVLKSVSALTAQVAGNLSMKATLTIKNTDPTPSEEATDTETAITLVYNF